LLGIDAGQLARKPETGDFDLHWEVRTREWIDPKTKNPVRETQGFGIDFTRSIDGFETSGFGDVFIDFGNNAKVHEIEVSWRNLQPYQLRYDFVTSDEVVNSVQNRKTALPTLDEWPVSEIKTLTITNATPRYARKQGDERMDFVFPALQLDAIIDNGKTNKAIWFQTGLFGHTTD
jgi:hypothetical protein